jgi:L-amino acid N-acyltransferase YncA
MAYRFEPLTEEDRSAVVSIFNYFVENTFAAYPERKVDEGVFDRFRAMAEGYPAITVRTDSDQVAGFAFLHAYHPAETLRRSAEATYFLMPEHTRKGIGKAIVALFTEQAGKLAIDCLLANMSSLNEQSIMFHTKHGFEECGRFRRVGRKFGTEFDIVWMQKPL